MRVRKAHGKNVLNIQREKAKNLYSFQVNMEIKAYCNKDPLNNLALSGEFVIERVFFSNREILLFITNSAASS